MNLEYPYQLVAFLDKEPKIGEPVYGGKNGWYPQAALKRRFKIIGLSENELFLKIGQYCQNSESFDIKTGTLTQPDRMPVKILEITPSPQLMKFHQDFIAYMGDELASRYPERDGASYFPHVTAEYNGEMVIRDELFSNKEFQINNVLLLKDTKDEDSVACRKFDLL
ncbi:MAG: hypothetical protein JWM00_329 [Candidatus Saccharibacteria bacterium]|nr:hypothetical protein [Candidatus Saccharibacteria bacterium]